MDYPNDRRYTREHEWARPQGGEMVVGITFHAQEELGDVVYLDLPAVGTAVVAGKPFGSVESVKAVSDLYAPVSGTVTRVNEALVDKPETVNKDPHGEGWLIVLRADDQSQYDSLLDAAAYTAYVAEEKGRH